MIRKLIKPMLFVSVIIAVSLAGCSKQKDDVSKFTFELNDYIINYGSLSSFGVTEHVPSTYKYNLILAGPGITFDANSNNFTGKGNYISIDMYSINPEFVKTGSYVFDGFSSKDSLTFDRGEFAINYDFAAKTSDTICIVKTGIIQVNKRGNIYELTLNLFTPNDEQVKGSFTGFLENHTPLPTTK